MRLRNQSKAALTVTITASLLVVCFQNCSGGFRSGSVMTGSSLASASIGSSTEIPTPTPAPSATPLANAYVLVEDFSGASFFSHFNFFSSADPTHGYVTYVDQPTAQAQALVSINSAGHAVISVDSTNVATGSGRSAVRIVSNSNFSSGLFIIDVNHMPEGLGTWPAFWSVGPSWPSGGEIDVIEGVNNANLNASTLHTQAGCSMSIVDPTTTMTGTYDGSRDCNSNNANDGCSTVGGANGFGPAFNQSSGGVYAYLWSSSEIAVFFWPRAKIPADIISGGSPNPANWGRPVSYFRLGSNCPASDFTQHNLVINTTFCGDWAGNVYAGANGSGSSACTDYVKNNPAAFKNAYWEINTLRAYKINQ